MNRTRLYNSTDITRASLVTQMVKNLLPKQESWVRSLVWEDPLEKEMATHSSILAWSILRTEESGGLQSMGLQTVGCNWVTNTFTFTILQRRKGVATWEQDRSLKEQHLEGNISAFQETGKRRGRHSRQGKQHVQRHWGLTEFKGFQEKPQNTFKHLSLLFWMNWGKNSSRIGNLPELGRQLSESSHEKPALPKSESVSHSVVSNSDNPMDCSLPCSSIHGILQAGRLEWVAILFSKGSSWPRDWTCVSCTAGRFFTIWATREAWVLPGTMYSWSKVNVFLLVQLVYPRGWCYWQNYHGHSTRGDRSQCCWLQQGCCEARRPQPVPWQKP